MMQLHRDTKSPRREPELVALVSGPEAVLQDHALTEQEQLLSEPPQSPLEAYAPFFVVVVDAEIVLPLIRRQPYGSELGRELPGERRLARSRQTTDENQASVRHADPDL